MTGPAAVDGAPPPYRAHAVLHCNLNTADGARATAFYLAVLGLEPNMRSVARDADSRGMGLDAGTDSTTNFLYDRRGPRTAPALELVHWTRPPTVPDDATLPASAFRAIGYEVPSLRRVRRRLVALEVPVRDVDAVGVRGETRAALVATDPDGVRLEVVEGEAAGHPGVLSHLRLVCGDLGRTAAWYATIGWRVAARAGGSLSLGLPDDPAFSLELTADPAAGDTRNRPANARGLYRIALAVDDVRAAAAELAGLWGGDQVPAPTVIPMPDTPTGGFTVLFLRDPDGAMVELVERPRTELRRPGPGGAGPGGAGPGRP